MGKVRAAKRSRVHLKAPRPSGTSRAKDEGNGRMEVSDESSEVVPLPEDIMKSIPVVPLTGRETEKQNLPLKKRDKQRLRHERWLQKLEVCHLSKESVKAAEKRKKTVVVGDMQPLAAALPELSSISLAIAARPGSRTQETPVHRVKTHKPTLLGEVDHFQKVLDHPAFKADPLEAISQHIHNVAARDKTQKR